MTVTSETRTDDYVGDGVVTVFPYTFVILDASELKVFFNAVEQIGGFTVDGVGDQSGGNVTFAVAPADLINIRLSRIVPLTQETDLLAFDPFPSEAVENSMDQIVFQTQQLQGQIDILTGAAGVLSVFGRSGNVVAQLNDYTASLVANVPAGLITSTNVQDALDELESLIVGGGAPVDSVFGRVGIVVAQADDYTAIEVANIPSGNITSDNVQDALDELDSLIIPAPVTSVFGRVGIVVADPDDYTDLTVLTVGTTLTVTTEFLPSVADGLAIGSGAAPFSDLFLAGGGFINFGANGALTHTTGFLTVEAVDFGIRTVAAPFASLHVRTSSSGAANAQAGTIAVFERTGNGAIAVLVPDTGIGSLAFGSPSDNAHSILAARYNAASPFMTMQAGALVRFHFALASNPSLGIGIAPTVGDTLVFDNIPVAAPAQSGALWSNGGVINIVP